MAHPVPEEWYAAFRRKYPRAWYWVRRGLHPKAARELVKAGIRTERDLAGKSREELTAIPGVGGVSLAVFERLLGSPVPSRSGYWLERGLRPAVANALARAGIDSAEELGRLTREQFLSHRGLGPVALRACEAVLGRPLEHRKPRT